MFSFIQEFYWLLQVRHSELDQIKAWCLVNCHCKGTDSSNPRFLGFTLLFRRARAHYSFQNMFFHLAELPAYWCTKRVCITFFWENSKVRKHQKSSTIILIRLQLSLEFIDCLHWPLKSRLTGDKSVLVINNYCKLLGLIMTRDHDGLQQTNYH